MRNLISKPVSGRRLLMAGQNALRFYGRVAYDERYEGLALDDDEGRRIAAQLDGLALQVLRPSERVDGPVLGGSHEPRRRVVRNAALRPLLEGSDQCVLREIFRATHVPGHARERGYQTFRLDAPHARDYTVDFRARHHVSRNVRCE